MSYLRYLCLFAYSGVQHILLIFFCHLVHPKLPASLDCPFLIAPLVCVCTVVSVCDITGMYLFIVPSVCTVVSVCDITGMYLFIVPSVCTVVSVCDITGMYLFIVPSVCTVVSVCDITGMYLFTLDQIY